MDKTEIIQIHSILHYIKKIFIEKGIGDDSSFKRYNALGIKPNNARASKEEHKQAMFVLMEELDILTENKK